MRLLPARNRADSYLTESRLVICGLIAGTQMTWGSIVPALPHFVTELGIGAAGLGWIMASFGIGRLLSNMPAGYLTQRLPAWPMLIVSVLAVLASTMAVGLMTDPLTVIVLRFITGVFAGGAITVGHMLVMIGAPAHARGRVATFMQSVSMAGTAIGPAVGGIAMSFWGVTASFFAACVGGIVFLIWAVVRKHAVQADLVDIREPRTDKQAQTEASADDAPAFSWRSRDVLIPLIAINGIAFVTFSVRFGGQHSLVPLLSVDLVDLDPGLLGVGYTALTVLSLVFLPAIGKASDKWDRRWTIVPSMLLGAILTPLYLLTNSAGQFLSVMIIAGLFTVIANGVPLAMLADVVPAKKFGVANGMFRTWGDLGTIVGPIILTAAYEVNAALAVYLMAALILSGALCGVFSVRRREHRELPDGAAPAQSPS